MRVFPIRLQDKTAMDIGASTGGFTDCMLQNGAKKVYAVDVGYGQLAWKLRTDPRVINLERTNIRYATKEQIPDPIDFISVDVSFISLKLVLPVAKLFMRDGAQAVCLITVSYTHLDVYKRQALNQAAAIAQNMDQENNVENLIKAKGFADCVAFIQNGECSVVVASEGLLDSEAITIKDIVAGQTGISFDNIKIVEAN